MDEEIYKSESATGHRNRAIGWMLRNFDILEEDPRSVVEAYFQQCSLNVTCADLAVMGATLANQGINPITAEQAIAHEYVDNILAVMASCGMYDWSGEWIYRVGLPAKSGVGGGILAVLPGQLGVGVYSPPLDEQGNSVRGIKVCTDLARSLALHMFNPSASAQPALNRAYSGAQVRSKRRLSNQGYNKLRSYGARIRVMELQGALLFSTFEPVVREIVKQSAYCKFIVLNLRGVFSIDEVALKMITDLSRDLAESGVELLCCETEKLGKLQFSACFPENLIFFSEDAALEHCENGILAEFLPDEPKSSLPVTLDKCGLLTACSEEELSFLDEYMETKTFLADETIIQTGTKADELYIIISGVAEVRLELPNRSFHRLDALSSGMCFGEVAFLDHAPRSADVYAVTDMQCRIIDRSLFGDIEEKMPKLKSKLLNEIAIQLADRLRHANLENSALRS